ncbi:MAG: hypothetical protein HY574_08630 [candidate division NC10 bacterium]|nr:hypothetical protein [candidate division NC10 bacterium]
MNARAICYLVLCCFLAQSANALANDQPTDPCKPAEAEDQPKPPSEEKDQVPPAKKPSEILLYKRKRPDTAPTKPGGPAERPETPDK